MRVLLFGFMVLCLLGCSAPRCVSVPSSHEAVRYAQRVDSVYVKDSIFIDRWRQGDTLYVTRTMWRVMTREVLRRDSICITDTITKVIEVERKRTWIETATTKIKNWFMLLLVALCAVLAWRVFK